MTAPRPARSKREVASLDHRLDAEQRIVASIVQVEGAFACCRVNGLTADLLESAASRAVFAAVERHYASGGEEAKDSRPPEPALRALLGARACDLDEFITGRPYATELDQVDALRELRKHRALRDGASELKVAIAAADRGDEPEFISRLGRAEARYKEVAPSRTGTAPSAILDRWFNEGPLQRLPTGIAALDRACRGGLPVPWRVILVGAPSAGKTALQVTIANSLARSGACVGLLAIDEDPEDLIVRFAQMAGISVEQAESRDPVVLSLIDTALKGLNIRLYDGTHTIESAAADIASWSRAQSRPGVLGIDSLQAARSEGQRPVATPRELVEANVNAIRRASTEHKLLVISTSEANRAAYRLVKPRGEEQSDLAAGAESRAIEFSAQTQLVLRTPADHPNIVHVRVAKNRRANRGVEFWLDLDRDAHTLRECAEPPKGATGPDASQSATDRALAAKEDAKQLAELVARTPGMSERKLREAARSRHVGVERLARAKQYLQEHGLDGRHLRNVGGDRTAKWVLVEVPDEEG